MHAEVAFGPRLLGSRVQTSCVLKEVPEGIRLGTEKGDISAPAKAGEE